jgi:hypothetical protein
MRIQERITAFLNFLHAQPRNIFLIDGIGAALSALFLLGILAQFPEYVGLSKNIFLALGAIACLLCTYSFACFFFSTKKRPALLGVTIAANTLYAALTLSLLLYFGQMISFLGMYYFISELIVLGILIKLEYGVLMKWLGK